ncbi:ORF116 [Ranid herpesvirus 1]|uniref:ORF116 n=1 Tax=Ranid herpesvirus 1 TaxID=85655 RepID=Q14VL4_9VIRU|nr:ORF116 [Ranid herpesvirus 1]ABG25727.1 ORF116 [Ranid herpesvirus 1]
MQYQALHACSPVAERWGRILTTLRQVERHTQTVPMPWQRTPAPPEWSVNQYCDRTLACGIVIACNAFYSAVGEPPSTDPHTVAVDCQSAGEWNSLLRFSVDVIRALTTGQYWPARNTPQVGRLNTDKHTALCMALWRTTAHTQDPLMSVVYWHCVLCAGGDHHIWHRFADHPRLARAHHMPYDAVLGTENRQSYKPCGTLVMQLAFQDNSPPQPYPHIRESAVPANLMHAWRYGALHSARVMARTLVCLNTPEPSEEVNASPGLAGFRWQRDLPYRVPPPVWNALYHHYTRCNPSALLEARMLCARLQEEVAMCTGESLLAAAACCPVYLPVTWVYGTVGSMLGILYTDARRTRRAVRAAKHAALCLVQLLYFARRLVDVMNTRLPLGPRFRRLLKEIKVHSWKTRGHTLFVKQSDGVTCAQRLEHYAGLLAMPRKCSMQNGKCCNYKPEHRALLFALYTRVHTATPMLAQRMPRIPPQMVRSCCSDRWSRELRHINSFFQCTKALHTKYIITLKCTQTLRAFVNNSTTVQPL